MLLAAEKRPQQHVACNMLLPPSSASAFHLKLLLNALESFQSCHALMHHQPSSGMGNSS